MLHSKLQNPSEKHKNQYILKNKLKGRKKGPQYLIISFLSKDIPTLNELVIKNALVKR